MLINLGFVNVFLIQAGEGYILIDTGMGQQWNQLETKLLRAGCLPGKLKLVVITHGDFDHTGNCAQLKKKYQAKIAMHRGDTAMVKTGVPLNRHTRTFMGKIFLLLGKVSSWRIGFETFQPDILLEDGQDLREYGLSAKIIYTPGHTKGSITVLTSNGELFVGDTFANRTRPDLAPFIQDFQELHDSIAKLKRLKAKVVYPGHGKPFPYKDLLSIAL